MWCGLPANLKSGVGVQHSTNVCTLSHGRTCLHGLLLCYQEFCMIGEMASISDSAPASEPGELTGHSLCGKHTQSGAGFHGSAACCPKVVPNNSPEHWVYAGDFCDALGGDTQLWVPPGVHV